MSLSVVREDYGSAGHSSRAIDASAEAMVKLEREVQSQRDYIRHIESRFREIEGKSPADRRMRQFVIFLIGASVGAILELISMSYIR